MEDDEKRNLISSPDFDQFNIRKGKVLGIEKVKTTLLQISPTRGQDNGSTTESGPESAGSESEPGSIAIKPIAPPATIEYADRGL